MLPWARGDARISQFTQPRRGALFRNGATLHRPDQKQNGRVLLPGLVEAEVYGSRETKGKARTFAHCAGINLGWLVFPGDPGNLSLLAGESSPRRSTV